MGGQRAALAAPGAGPGRSAMRKILRAMALAAFVVAVLATSGLASTFLSLVEIDNSTTACCAEESHAGAAKEAPCSSCVCLCTACGPPPLIGELPKVLVAAETSADPYGLSRQDCLSSISSPLDRPPEHV